MAKNSKQKCCPLPSVNKPIINFNPYESRQYFAKICKALAHPVRIQILQILKTKKSCICGELVDDLPLSQATVSQHLKVLKNAGLICGTIRGPATCYCLDIEGLQQFKTLFKNFFKDGMSK